MKKQVLLLIGLMLVVLPLVSCITKDIQPAPTNASVGTAKETPDTSPQFNLKIEAGEGGTIPAGMAENRINGKYAKGARIDISARSFPDYRFTGWTSSNGGTFDDEANSTTTFTMPGNDTVITAHFALNKK